jgi:hypothetical protein
MIFIAIEGCMDKNYRNTVYSGKVATKMGLGKESKNKIYKMVVPCINLSQNFF